MATPIERARAYLDTLEADRRAALALSEQKAEEAKLIAARQEGFQAALTMLGEATTADNGDAYPKTSRRRRERRRIPQLILRELSFSGAAMSARQIAKAIDYHPERTETALKRMEETRQVLRDGEGRWVAGISPSARNNGHALAGRNGKSLSTGTLNASS
jgi:hypothetical protein